MFDSEAFNTRLFFPRRDDRGPGPGAVDRFVAVPGARLHLRRHRHARARFQVLLFHGNGDVLADCDGDAAAFASVGCELVVCDYRGYGQSSGGPTLRTLYADAAPLAHAVLQESTLPLLVLGRSLGSLAVAQLYGSPPLRTAGFVFESGLTSLFELVRRRGLVPPTAFTNAERSDFDPVERLARGTSPILVIHGARDRTVKPNEARVAFAAAGGTQKQLVLLPGCGHTGLGSAPAYWAALAAFVDVCAAPAAR